MDAGIWTAIAAGGPAVIVIALLLIYGVPKWLEVRSADQKREAEIQKVATELAKEGPTMVIAELRLAVNELKAEVKTLRTENKGLHDDRRKCEAEQSELKSQVAGLKAQNAEQAGKILRLESQLTELTKQQSIWQKNESSARVAGDAKNAGGGK